MCVYVCVTNRSTVVVIEEGTLIWQLMALVVIFSLNALEADFADLSHYKSWQVKACLTSLSITSSHVMIRVVWVGAKPQRNPS